MTAIRSYLLSVAASAIFICLITEIVPEGRVKKTASYIGNMFLLLAVLSPLLNLDDQIIQRSISALEQQFNTAQIDVSMEHDRLLKALIKEQCETYILDKAAGMGLSLEIAITTGGDQTYPQPIGATIMGDYSLIQQEQLARILEEDLGIPREEQQWKER